ERVVGDRQVRGEPEPEEVPRAAVSLSARDVLDRVGLDRRDGGPVDGSVALRRGARRLLLVSRCPLLLGRSSEPRHLSCFERNPGPERETTALGTAECGEALLLCAWPMTRVSRTPASS